MRQMTCRLALLLLTCFLQACGFSPRNDMASGVEPLAIEKDVLEQMFARLVAGREDSCWRPLIGPQPEGPSYWPRALTFDDGKLSHNGDPRYDRLWKLWDKAKARRSKSIRMPQRIAKRAFRIVADADSDPTCLAVETVNLPRFSGDFAFVATSAEFKSTPYSHSGVYVFQFKNGRWEYVASGGEQGGPEY